MITNLKISRIVSWLRQILLASFGVGLATGATASLIPPQYISSVVAVGALQPVFDQGKVVRMDWVTIGTGFFYGKLVKGDVDPSKREYETYLVTAKHVVQKYQLAQKSDLLVRVNPKNASSNVKEFNIPNIPTAGGNTWFYHPDEKVDVAAVRVNLSTLRDQGFDANFFPNDTSSASAKKLTEIGVSAGDGVFVLGFPLQLSGKQRSYVIVREGIIARIAEFAEGASPTFMIDSFAFPGNSGGPVILKPEAMAIQRTKSNSNALLIGLILDYQPYNDVAVSSQTQQPRVIFQENTGLADVLPVDRIDECIEAWRKTQPQVQPQTQPPATSQTK